MTNVNARPANHHIPGPGGADLDADPPVDLVDRVAIQHEAMAKAARQELEQAAPENRDGYMLQNEADAALVAICATAFALEALTRELDDLITLPGHVGSVAAQPTASRQARLGATEAVGRSKGLVTVWTRELAWLFGVRGGAMRYEGMSKPTQPHPVGMNVSVAQVTYSPENATRAVDLLLGILVRCRDRPKPPVRGWSNGTRHVVDELVSRRR